MGMGEGENFGKRLKGEVFREGTREFRGSSFKRRVEKVIRSYRGRGRGFELVSDGSFYFCELRVVCDLYIELFYGGSNKGRVC